MGRSDGSIIIASSGGARCARRRGGTSRDSTFPTTQGIQSVPYVGPIFRFFFVGGNALIEINHVQNRFITGLHLGVKPPPGAEGQRALDRDQECGQRRADSGQEWRIGIQLLPGRNEAAAVKAS